MSRTALAAFLCFWPRPVWAAEFPAPVEGDFTADFQFTTGESCRN